MIPKPFPYGPCRLVQDIPAMTGAPRDEEHAKRGSERLKLSHYPIPEFTMKNARGMLLSRLLSLACVATPGLVHAQPVPPTVATLPASAVAGIIASDSFGHTVAAAGADRMLIGAYQHDTGATDAGAAWRREGNPNE